MSAIKIAAVVVAYFPEIQQLSLLLKSVQRQADLCFVVNNGSSDDLLKSLLAYGIETARIEVIDMGHNSGLGKAQNAGIAAARSAGATHVLILDQDSVPYHSMIAELLRAAEKIQEQGGYLACVGPRYLDDRQQNPPPFIRVKGLKLERCSCATEDAVVAVDYLISSGCLIPMAILDQVGGMREDLFIDYVDIEWGLRARRFGLQSYGVCAAKMSHSLGDQPIRFFGKNLPLHSPLRHYYHFRNAVLLYKEQWIPMNWKLVDGWRLLLKYVFYSTFAKPRREHWRMMTLGVWHGVRGKTGKLVLR